MSFLLKNGNVYINGRFDKSDILIDGDIIVSAERNIFSDSADIIDCSNKYIFPGFIDVHVHFREPGFSYKETIKTGSSGAAHGGYTTVFTMPNLKPCPDSVKNLRVQTDIISRDSLITVLPYGTITKGESGIELSDMEDMSPFVCGFSDDGRGVQNEEVMKSAMLMAKKLKKIIAAHCEDNSLLNGGYIHDGKYASLHHHKGISSESEWKQIERDIALARQTGVSYHVCHISTKESVDLIRSAKKDGVDISCETGPHYLVLDDSCLLEDGRFKMNPPLRDKTDRLALIDGIKDGTIDMIATDHAPHSVEEKSKGLCDSLMGISGIETSFSVLYTELVKNNIISLEKLIELMSISPGKRFGIRNGINVGKPADVTIFDLENEYEITPDDFLSMGKATPFSGKKVFGKCIMTICKGKIVYG